VSEQPLTGESIQAYVAEVADELKADEQQTLLIVGGALLAWRGLRDTTRDVDSVKRLDDAMKAAVARVAERHDLAPHWLNDSASAYMPDTLKIDDCEVLFESPSLRVLGAPANQVFLMKVNASRATDTDDLEVLWPLCTFTSPEAAAEAFYEAYPTEEFDPHLADHIRRITGG
jgi:hypothetical protein